jgi:bisphosphoglycerate-dependent phosphoglycerate mutase
MDEDINFYEASRVWRLNKKHYSVRKGKYCENKLSNGSVYCKYHMKSMNINEYQHEKLHKTLLL